jgi:hypothetical protein
MLSWWFAIRSTKAIIAAGRATRGGERGGAEAREGCVEPAGKTAPFAGHDGMTVGWERWQR